MENTYIDFLFEDEDSGEQFFVEINLKECGSYKEARKKAIEIANENFDNAKIQPGWLPPYEADLLGLKKKKKNRMKEEVLENSSFFIVTGIRPLRFNLGKSTTFTENS